MKKLFAAIVLLTSYVYADSTLHTNSTSNESDSPLTSVDLVMPSLIITKDVMRERPLTVVKVNALGMFTDHDNNYATYSNLTLNIYQCDAIKSQVGDNGRTTIQPINAYEIGIPLFPDKQKRFSSQPCWPLDYSWHDLSNATVIDFNGTRFGACDFAKQYPIIGDCTKPSHQSIIGYSPQGVGSADP